jgi:hypothetical protein
MYNIPIAPKTTPHSARGEHTAEVNFRQRQDENIVYMHKGKCHNTLFIDIVTRHKKEYTAAKRLTQRYDRQSAIKQVAESMYHDWIMEHPHNCFVHVNSGRKVILGTEEAIFAIKEKCKVLFREKQAVTTVVNIKKKEQQLVNKILGTMYPDLMIDSDGNVTPIQFIPLVYLPSTWINEKH